MSEMPSQSGPIDPALLQAVRLAVIQAKWDLSSGDVAEIVVRDPGDGRVLYRRAIGRGEFEALIQPVIERTLAPCRLALADAGLVPSQIDETVLVGSNRGTPVAQDPKSRAGQAFRNIARRIKGEDVPFLEMDKQVGIWSRLQKIAGRR